MNYSVKWIFSFGTKMHFARFVTFLLLNPFSAALGGRPGGGGQSAFLQKRLGKGQKYFDSGDYQMAKQGGRQGRGALAVLAPPTGEEHPTPATVPARKSSILPAGHALPVAQPSSPALVQ